MKKEVITKAVIAVTIASKFLTEEIPAFKKLAIRQDVSDWYASRIIAGDFVIVPEIIRDDVAAIVGRRAIRREPKNEAELAKIVAYFGGTLYRVGGSVRDELLGLEPNDYDYVVVGNAAVKRAVARAIGGRFGNEYPVLRKNLFDRKVEISFTNLSIEQDLYRRDTTINAMAINIMSGEIIDPFGGRKDIVDGVFRHVSVEHFNPLATFRLARQLAKMEKKTGRDWSVAPETLRVMNENHPEESPEHRIRFEYYDVRDDATMLDRFYEILSQAEVYLSWEEMEPDYWGNTITPVVWVFTLK